MTLTTDKVNPSVLPAEAAVREAIPTLSDLVNDVDFLAMHVLPHREVPAEDWYEAYHHDDPEHSYSVQVFVWPPGTATRVHDHSSWGAFCCVVGSVLEERYERLDDGSLPDHARLRMRRRFEWSGGAGISTVLPGDKGIHKVGNPSDETAISVHLYGPRLGEIDGRDYEPSRSYVCDRPQDRSVQST